jgi:hypothetical protein
LRLKGVVAIMLFAGGLRIVDFPVLFGTKALAWYVSLSLTVLWVIGIANAFKLILETQVAVSALFAIFVAFVVAVSDASTLFDSGMNSLQRRPTMLKSLPTDKKAPKGGIAYQTIPYGFG